MGGILKEMQTIADWGEPGGVRICQQWLAKSFDPVRSIGSQATEASAVG
jgi:hypothetical protein